MKQIIFILFSFMIATAAMAADVSVPTIVAKSFSNNFPSAVETSWSSYQQGYRVEFIQEGQPYTAFYDEAGNFVAVSRYIRFTDLTPLLQSGLRKEQKGYTITEIFQVENADGIYYYATLNDQNKTRVLQSGGNGNWRVYFNRKG
jgi:hypothetical protein